MNENCPRCQLKYQREPGFFFGALYLNYAFTVALIITVGVILSILWPDASTLAYIAIVTLLVILLLPWIYRYSRALYLYWFGAIEYESGFDSPN